MMRRHLSRLMLAVALAASLPLAAADAPAVAAKAAIAVDTEEAPLTPAETFAAVVAALRHEDFDAFVLAMASPADLARQRRQWDERITRDLERAAKIKVGGKVADDGAPIELKQAWLKLQDDAGVDALVAEWQPKIAEQAQAQSLSINLAIAGAMQQMAKAEGTTPEQRAQQRDLLLAVQGWMNRTDFSDPQRLRRALVAIATEVRASGIVTIDELQLLGFDEALAQGDRLLRAAKGVLAAYDIDATAILDSARAREEKLPDGNLRLHSSVAVLGVTVTNTNDYALFDDRWVDARFAHFLREREAEGETIREVTDEDIDAMSTEIEFDAPPPPPSAAIPGGGTPKIGSCGPST